MSSWCAVRNIPPRACARPAQARAPGGEVFRLDHPDGFWAVFWPNPDGSVGIRSCSGAYEDECHGEAYPADEARRYWRLLQGAGFAWSLVRDCFPAKAA